MLLGMIADIKNIFDSQKVLISKFALICKQIWSSAAKIVLTLLTRHFRQGVFVDLRLADVLQIKCSGQPNGAEKKACDRSAPVWPPQSNAEDDRFRRGGFCSHTPGGLGDSAPKLKPKKKQKFSYDKMLNLLLVKSSRVLVEEFLISPKFWYHEEKLLTSNLFCINQLFMFDNHLAKMLWYHEVPIQSFFFLFHPAKMRRR